MGLFDFFKGKEIKSGNNNAAGVGGPLSAKLLFYRQPVIDIAAIADNIKPNVAFNHAPLTEGGAVFIFPEVKSRIGGAEVAVNYIVSTTNKGKPDVADSCYQQNWEWKEGNDIVKNCDYGIVVAEIMGTMLPHKQRIEVFGNFLTAVVMALKPQAILSIAAEKLINPGVLVSDWDTGRFLTGVCNVRLFNLQDSATGEVLMDTLGLHTLGLPDFQIICDNIPVGSVAGFLWAYVYYIYEKGDVIIDGNTVEGIAPGSKWKCGHKPSLAAPERLAIQIFPS